MRNINVRVASLASAVRIKRRFDAVLTVEDPGLRKGLRFHKTPHPDHLILRFEDVDFEASDVALPHRRHVEAAIEFAREHRSGSVLIHCKAGIARSAALALAIIADRLGDGREEEAVRHLLEIRPEAVPNLLLLPMADEVLERNGRLEKAWMEIENSHGKYAHHRRLKRLILERNPTMFARPLASLELTASRILPHTLTSRAGLTRPEENVSARM